MPRYSISNVPTGWVGPYAGSGVFRGRLGDITYIQRIYDTYKYHGSNIGHFGRFSIFYSPGRVTAPYIRSMPI